ncbi:MAG: hypothetical protein JNK77_01390 [Saprospiraceae bacterium]|nr:hypothetical protein [Saprospiraceae bacterium]
MHWYYFGARWQDPAAGRWWTVDALATARNWLTPFNFCSDNPISRIDPLGLTDYELKGNGKIIIVKGTETTDGSDRLIKGNAKYNKNGKLKGKEGSTYISVDKGVFDKMESNEDYQFFKTSSGEKADQLYDFIAANVGVEYGKADLITGEGKEESVFMTTYSNREVGILNDWLASKKGDDSGLKLFSHIHNHPNTGDQNMVGSYGPSGQVGGDRGDIPAARRLNEVFGGQTPMPRYYIWRNYVRTKYNENGKLK